MDIHQDVVKIVGATALERIDLLQELWSGYGSINRYHLKGSTKASVIVKHIQFPDNGTHPRGWSGDLSHQRKVRSYAVEMAWYQDWSSRCSSSCRVPMYLGGCQDKARFFMVLEDVDAAGFPLRKSGLTFKEMTPCISWLASFHAHFLSESPKKLWPIGTYWHLDTRPDELDALDDRSLKAAAPKIDALLNQAQFQTVVHGDAKVANFCFSKEGSAVAAVDFQYVGRGVGMKDLVYFVGSCLNEAACEAYEDAILETYFIQLKHALKISKKAVDMNAIEQEWRGLYDVAWADFHRFIKGWSPGHWKINSYSERMVASVIKRL